MGRLPWAGAPGTGLDRQGLQSNPRPTITTCAVTHHGQPGGSDTVGGTDGRWSSPLSTCREPGSPLRRAGHPQHRYQTAPSYATHTHRLRSHPPCAEGQPCARPWEGLPCPLPVPPHPGPRTLAPALLPSREEESGKSHDQNPGGPLPAHAVQRANPPARLQASHSGFNPE